MDEIIKTISMLIIDVDESACSNELSAIINKHNESCSAFTQGITIAALTQLLLAKNIITDHELGDFLIDQVNKHTDHIKTLTENYTQIMHIMSLESREDHQSLSESDD